MLGTPESGDPVVAGRIFPGVVLRFPLGGFTMCPMEDMTPLPEFLVRLPEGAMLEEVLDLARTYSALSYYLTHRDTIDAYLLAQQRCIETARRELQARPSPFLAELRRRAAARRALPPACA
jgi:hypothetical protein